MLPRFLWQYKWARRRQGGKWERWGTQWVPVKQWSTPSSEPDLYGTGDPPEREDHD
jgi:hypothetical protein